MKIELILTIVILCFSILFLVTETPGENEGSINKLHKAKLLQLDTERRLTIVEARLAACKVEKVLPRPIYATRGIK